MRNRKTRNRTPTGGKAGNSSLFADRRRMLKVAVAGVVALGGAASLHAYDKQKRELHDLDIVGSGHPVIVQIHDPGCPSCRRLKRAVQTALESNDTVRYRLADIRTPEGRDFQHRYGVPHVTLLWFSATGKHLHTSSGVQESVDIERLLERFFTAPAS